MKKVRKRQIEKKCEFFTEYIVRKRRLFLRKIDD